MNSFFKEMGHEIGLFYYNNITFVSIFCFPKILFPVLIHDFLILFYWLQENFFVEKKCFLRKSRNDVVYLRVTVPTDSTKGFRKCKLAAWEWLQNFYGHRQPSLGRTYLRNKLNFSQNDMLFCLFLGDFMMSRSFFL